MNDETTQSRGMMHRFWNPFAWYMLGVCTGAVGMIYQYETHIIAKPVVTVEQDGAELKSMGQSTNSSASSQQARDAAPPLAQAKADDVRHLQRVKELRFSLEKLERTKAAHDAFLKYALAKDQDIQAMVAKLGEVGR